MALVPVPASSMLSRSLRSGVATMRYHTIALPALFSVEEVSASIATDTPKFLG